MNMWGWGLMGRGTGMGETREDLRGDTGGWCPLSPPASKVCSSQPEHLGQCQGQAAHGLLLGSLPSKPLSQVFAVRAFKVWAIIILIRIESAECRGSLKSGTSLTSGQWKHVWKSRAPAAQVPEQRLFCFALTVLGGSFFPRKRKKNNVSSALPLPSSGLSASKG